MTADPSPAAEPPGSGPAGSWLAGDAHPGFHPAGVNGEESPTMRFEDAAAVRTARGAPEPTTAARLPAGRIVVVGDLVTDVLTLAAGPMRMGSDTPARVRLTGGGAGANAAAWLAEIGHPVTLICCVGADDAGQQRIDELTELGVDVRASLAPSRPTGVVVVIVSPNGERSMFPDRGANDRLDAPHVLSVLHSLSDIARIHVSGYTLLGDGSRRAGLAALRFAREHGHGTSVDVASAAPLAAVGAGTALSWAGEADILLANADEAEVLTRGEDPVRAAHILAAGRQAAIVKCGAEGAIWADGDRTVTTGSARSTAVDTTGAGDAFAAGLLSCLASTPADIPDSESTARMTCPVTIAPPEPALAAFPEPTITFGSPVSPGDRDDWAPEGMDTREAGELAAAALAAGCELGSRAIAQPGARPARPAAP